MCVRNCIKVLGVATHTRPLPFYAPCHCRPQDTKHGVPQIRILRTGAHMNLPRNVSFDFYISYMIWKCLSNDHMPNGTEDRTTHNLVLLFNVAVWHCSCCVHFIFASYMKYGDYMRRSGDLRQTQLNQQRNRAHNHNQRTSLDDKINMLFKKCVWYELQCSML